MTDKPTAEGLVTQPAKGKAEAPPFTQPNPDPAAQLDPIKAGQLVSSPHAEHGAKPKRRRKVASAVRRLKRAHAAVAKDDKVLAADTKSNAAQDHDDAMRTEGKAAYASAVAHEVDSAGELSPDAALMLRLSDGEEFIDATISVDPSEIVPAANGSTYTKDVDIGPDGPPVKVAEAWLVSLTGEAVRCEVGPINGGGGHHAKIPAGHLKF